MESLADGLEAPAPLPTKCYSGRCPAPVTWLIAEKPMCARHAAKYRYEQKEKAKAIAADELRQDTNRQISKLAKLIPGHDWPSRVEMIERTAALLLAWSEPNPDMNRLNLLLDNVVPQWGMWLNNPEMRERLSGVSTP